jgi:hypothetical protein
MDGLKTAFWNNGFVRYKGSTIQLNHLPNHRFGR